MSYIEPITEERATIQSVDINSSASEKVNSAEVCVCRETIYSALFALPVEQRHR